MLGQTISINSFAMSQKATKFIFPHDKIRLVLRNSYKENEFFGVDMFESKRIHIILAKYKSHHSFHQLSGKLTAYMHPFTWDKLSQCYRIEMDKKVLIQMNKLEEAFVHYPINTES